MAFFTIFWALVKLEVLVAVNELFFTACIPLY